MPVTLPNGSTYKLCLLDTNALSEIVKHPTIEGRGYIERFPPTEYVPCFTVYNLVELRRHPNVFREFARFFSVYPSFATQPFQLVLDAEVAAKGRASVNDILLRAFTAFGPDSSFELTSFVSELFRVPAIAQLEADWRTRDQDVLNTWLTSKSKFNPQSPVPNARDAKQFVQDASIDTLCHLHPNVVQVSIDSNDIAGSLAFPSMQMMLYSQYYRVFDPTWAADDQEVTDVCISACAPYVDAVVSEKFQAEIYRKVRKHVSGMAGIEIAKLRDIRHTE